MKFHITLNDEDYIAFNICHNLTRNSNKRNFLIMMSKTSVLWVIAILLLSLFGKFNKLTIILLMSTYFAAVVYDVISYPKRVKKLVRKAIENLKKEGKLPYESDSIIEFLEDEMRETSSSGVRCKKYSEISRILYDEEHIFVMLGAMESWILPLRCLERKENELVEFLNGKLQKNGTQPDTQG